MTLDPRDADLVFLAWREAPAMLARHHEAVARALPDGWRGTVVLVENAAPATTARAARELVARHYGGATRRIALRMPRNYGFGRAMNLALAECPGEVALLQNSDGRPAPGMIETLVGALEARPRAVWVAPGIHGPGEPDHAAGPQYGEVELPGMALAVRRRAFLALGGFDPLFFFYNEDFDASRRIRAAGGELVRAPTARFDHGKGGRSARGRLIREFWFALTHQTLTLRHEPDRAGALLAGRRRALAAHAGEGDWPGLGGIAAAALLLPVSALAAARRRRMPWTGAQLDRWLARHRPKAERFEL
jgi:GT2 family glycosyltransferase